MRIVIEGIIIPLMPLSKRLLLFFQVIVIRSNSLRILFYFAEMVSFIQYLTFIPSTPPYAMFFFFLLANLVGMPISIMRMKKMDQLKKGDLTTSASISQWHSFIIIAFISTP
jgi:hypothetical protein